MLRINLLPPYIYDKQKKIKWIAIALALPFLALVACLWAAQNAQAAKDKADGRKNDALTQQSQYNNLVSQIKAEEDAVAATKAKQTFVANAIKYNEAWPDTYTSMRDVTSPKILLKSMYMSDDRKSLNFTGFCQYEEDLVRWWMFLRAQSDLYSEVHFRLPEHPWPPKSESNAGGGAGSMAMSGGGPGMAGSPGMGGGMAMSGGPGMGGGSPMGGGMAMSGGPGMGGSPGVGSFGGGGGSSDAVGDEEIEGRKGIKFSAFATLKKPFAGGITTPTWATAGGAGASGGGGGMNSGGPMMGGSGGMMATPPGGGMKGMGGK
jgi:hypothetical protein